MLSIRRIACSLLPFAAAVTIAACVDNSGPNFVDSSCTFAFAYDTTRMTRTSSGLFYQDLTVGGGSEIRVGNRAFVHYTGWLTDGKRFDANLPGDVAFGFAAAPGSNVIPGFIEGVVGMRVGGCRRLVIPPNLAYGSNPRDTTVIPRNATLIFQIALVGSN